MKKLLFILAAAILSSACFAEATPATTPSTNDMTKGLTPTDTLSVPAPSISTEAPKVGTETPASAAAPAVGTPSAPAVGIEAPKIGTEVPAPAAPANGVGSPTLDAQNQLPLGQTPTPAVTAPATPDQSANDLPDDANGDLDY